MTKYRAINGWTRERMKQQIRAGNNGTRATLGAGAAGCSYLADDGNKCFVGVFLPDGHAGQSNKGDAQTLLEHHPDLSDVLPLSSNGCLELQWIHDRFNPCNTTLSLHERADEWIDANVVEPGEPGWGEAE